jgi:hypothetical protein
VFTKAFITDLMSVILLSITESVTQEKELKEEHDETQK